MRQCPCAAHALTPEHALAIDVSNRDLDTKRTTLAIIEAGRPRGAKALNHPDVIVHARRCDTQRAIIHRAVAHNHQLRHRAITGGST